MDGYPGIGGTGTLPINKGLLQRGAQQPSNQQHDRGQIAVEMECRMKLQAQLRDSIGALESSIEAVLAPSSPTTPGEASSHRDLTPARHVEYLAEGNRDLHSLIIWVDSIRQRVEL